MMFHLDARLGIVALVFAPLPVVIARLACRCKSSASAP